MRCPKCNAEKHLRVLDVRTTPDNHICRKRACYKCGYVFTTFEVPAEDYGRYKR